MPDDLLQEYRAATAKVDAAVEAISQRRHTEISCHAGCDACCVGGLTVLSVEAFAIQEFVDAVEGDFPTRRGGAACAFLSAAGRCTIYPVRPLLCRTHGLPIRMADPSAARDPAQAAEERPSEAPLGAKTGSHGRQMLKVLEDVEVCHLNFQNAAPSPHDVLDAERLSALLLVIEQRFRARAGLSDACERIALEDLCPG